jgi:hypothetical protein
MSGTKHGAGVRRMRRRAVAIVLACVAFAVPAIGAPAARAQSEVEFGLLFAQLLVLPQDTTPPAITIATPPDGATYAPGEVVNADYSCSDAGVAFMIALAGGSALDKFLALLAAHASILGPPTCAGPVPAGTSITTSPGPHTFTVTASDLAYTVADTNGDGVGDRLVSSPNASMATVRYTVPYPFTGFTAPVANPPEVNPVKAGQAVPIKFSLGGDRGLRILKLSAPSSRPIGCTSGPAGVPVPVPVPAYAAGNSGLQYDAASDTYTWVWKTDAAWKETCRTLTVTLDDGTTHAALFAFK